MNKNYTLRKFSAFVVFMGTTTVLLLLVANYGSVPKGVVVIVFLCALIMYKHVFDIVKSLRDLDNNDN